MISKFKNKIIQGDCLDVLKGLPDNSVDSVVTDPPYGLSKEPDIKDVLTKWLDGEEYDHGHKGFMGKSWDSFVPHPDIWKEVYRVLKPGGHALVFAGTRTQDLMTISLRLAGFEVRDVIEWIYFTGFPKSMDVSKAFDKRAGAERKVIGTKKAGMGSGKTFGMLQAEGDNANAPSSVAVTAPATPLARKWDGWGTALKPAHEPIILVRKPFKGTVVDNVEQYGTGAVNIDGCRIGDEKITTNGRGNMSGVTPIVPQSAEYVGSTHTGRFPANCITLDEDQFYSKYFNVSTVANISPAELSKKASKKDRNSDWQGVEITLDEAPTGHGNLQNSGGFERFNTSNRNSHPTVKPTALMAWLIRLITPPNGVVLDPFAGSGSTCVAAKREGFDYIGIEMTPEYVEIAKARTGEAV